MKIVEYTDNDGRMSVVLVPDNEDPVVGVHLGPPPLDTLGLDDGTELILNNALVQRRFIAAPDLLNRRRELVALLKDLELSIDVKEIVALYQRDYYAEENTE